MDARTGRRKAFRRFFPFLRSPLSALRSPQLALLLIAGLLPLTAWGQVEPLLAPGRAGVQVLTAAEIERAGARRLSDLFALLDGWHAYSVDEYTWYATAPGLGLMQQQEWMLLVDGQPVDVEALGVQNINLLPLHPLQLDSVVVYSVPGMHEGRMAASGALHLYTRKPPRGATARGSFSAGNEVGDPGPFLYTDRATPNIDRVGPDALGEASLAMGEGDLRASVKHSEHHVTDQQLRQRAYYQYEWAPGRRRPRLRLDAPALLLRTDGALGRHTLFAGHSRLEDLRFFDPLGLEIPTLHLFSHAGLGGDFAPGRPTGLGYRAGYTVTNLDEEPTRDHLAYDWREDRLSGHLEGRLGNRFIGAALGFGFDRVEVRTGYPVEEPSLFLSHAVGRLTLNAVRGWSQQFSAQVTHLEAERSFKGVMETTVRPTAWQTIAFTGAYAWEPFAERHDQWYWTRQGYAFLTDAGSSPALPGRFTARRSLTGDLAWMLHPAPEVWLTLTGHFRQLQGLTLDLYRYTYTALPVLGAEHFNATTQVRSGQAGRLAGGSANLRLRPLPQLEVQAHLTHLQAFTHDAAFRTVWAQQPATLASLSARYVPVPRFSLFARFRYVTSTDWQGFEPAAAQSARRFRASTPALTRLDLAAQKAFWGERLRALVAVRNALDAPFRTHPAGSVSRLTFFVQLEVDLNVGRGRR